jgi:transcriptional regulator with XRE-family HTH domain
MDLSPLSILRLAVPGAPTLRDVAALIGCSHSAVHMFEMGRYGLSAEKVKAYAKAVGAKPAEVRRRFLIASLAYHETLVRDLRREMRSRGITVSTGRRMAHSG